MPVRPAAAPRLEVGKQTDEGFIHIQIEWDFRSLRATSWLNSCRLFVNSLNVDNVPDATSALSRDT